MRWRGHQKLKPLNSLALRIAEHGIDAISERTTTKVPLEVVREERERTIAVARCRTGAVWRHDDVRERPQWTVRGERFGAEDIETGAGDGRVTERLDGCGFIDDRSPGDVHEVRLGTHERELAGSDHAGRLGRVGDR